MSTSRFLSIISGIALLGATLACPSTLRAQAAAYAIGDSTTGFVLDSAAGNKKLQIGSLTKIATAMVVLDWADSQQPDLAQLATVPESAQALSGGEGIGLRPGDRCSLRDLLYAAMMQSDNLAAQTLADHVGGAMKGRAEVPAVTHFVAQMNALARRLNMSHTRFLNAHGLDSLEKSLPYSTALDLLKLTQYALSNPSFRFYVSQKERRITIHTATGETQYMLRNTNELLGSQSIDGVKTGTTRLAGACLILSATRPPESRQNGETHVITPRRLNVVLLNSPNRFPAGSELLTKGWRLYDSWAEAGRPARGWHAK